MSNRIAICYLRAMLGTRAYRADVSVVASPLGGWLQRRPMHLPFRPA
jgi:hypothetical protein